MISTCLLCMRGWGGLWFLMVDEIVLGELCNCVLSVRDLL